MEEQRLIVTASPHIRDSASNRSLMGNVIIALIPTVVASAFIFGMRALLVVAVTTAACVGFEYLYTLLMHKRNPVGDLSAVVTGIILALNVPVGMPLWICIVGAFVAIIIVKQMFGGLGYNVANRIVLFLGFTSRMTAYVYPDLAVDALASATPLSSSVDQSTVSLLDLLLGLHGGMLGETCILTILVGLAFLLFTRTISFAIPGSIVGTVFVLTLIATGDLHTAVAEILSGGLMFGAVFMATDYVTSPFTTRGKLIYGIVIGLLTFLIRNFGSMNEGMSYAILMGNLLTPWFNEWGHQIPLGRVKPKKKAENKAAAASAGKGGAA